MCKGDGYVQLLLGGSETCHACKGSGIREKEAEKGEK
ncbi:YuiA family protein [Mechercharimyces sp. CAU 1602]|nr:YuiA family protein [Mechercharimyces sp. CAU 1602]MCS1351756.1 YuiA family protein [Mechercharimyces sp. CAU 1602]